MKGPPIPLKGGFEQDALTGWRKVLCYMRAGVPRLAKRKYWRRVRRWRKRESEDTP